MSSTNDNDKKWSTRALIGVLLVLVSASVFFVYREDVLSPPSSNEQITAGGENTTPPPELSAFELGEYYFNPEAGGVYDPVKAREYYMKALRDDPDGNPHTWYQLGRIDFIEGKLRTAIYKFEKQIEYFGNAVPNVHYMLGLTYGYLARETEDPEDWQKAEAGFTRFIEFAPASPWPRVDLAWVYFSQGKYEEMLPVLKTGLRHEPDQAWLLNTYGLALMNTGDREEAHTQFLKAKDAAADLTVEEWGKAYSGNDPSSWEEGLEEFRDVIDYNIELTEPKRSGIIPW